MSVPDASKLELLKVENRRLQAEVTQTYRTLMDNCPTLPHPLSASTTTGDAGSLRRSISVFGKSSQPVSTDSAGDPPLSHSVDLGQLHILNSEAGRTAGPGSGVAGGKDEVLRSSTESDDTWADSSEEDNLPVLGTTNSVSGTEDQPLGKNSRQDPGSGKQETGSGVTGSVVETLPTVNMDILPKTLHREFRESDSTSVSSEELTYARMNERMDALLRKVRAHDDDTKDLCKSRDETDKAGKGSGVGKLKEGRRLRRSMSPAGSISSDEDTDTIEADNPGQSGDATDDDVPEKLEDSAPRQLQNIADLGLTLRLSPGNSGTSTPSKPDSEEEDEESSVKPGSKLQNISDLGWTIEKGNSSEDENAAENDKQQQSKRNKLSGTPDSSTDNKTSAFTHLSGSTDAASVQKSPRPDKLFRPKPIRAFGEPVLRSPRQEKESPPSNNTTPKSSEHNMNLSLLTPKPYFKPISADSSTGKLSKKSSSSRNLEAPWSRTLSPSAAEGKTSKTDLSDPDRKSIGSSGSFMEKGLRKYSSLTDVSRSTEGKKFPWQLPSQKDSSGETSALPPLRRADLLEIRPR